VRSQPKKTGKKKPVSTANEELLRAILIIVTREFVMPTNPQRASELLKQVYPPDDFNDRLDDIGIDSDADSDDANPDDESHSD
jgi:hypothetical protein